MLRRSQDPLDLSIAATDGVVGRVEDLCVDDHRWAVRYLVVAAGHWWHGHGVLVALPWVGAVD